jgi:hypothetical protein
MTTAARNEGDLAPARRALVAVLLVATFAACSTPTTYTMGGGNVPAERGRTYRWTFDTDPLGGRPADFINILGEWSVAADGTAPSAPRVFRQTGEYRNADFPRIVVRDLTFTDLTVRVRCRLDAGDTDQACGLMFRFRDSENYYITRANALEGNVRLYRVVAGERIEFASASRPVAAGRWHALEATARGTTLTVRWNGEAVITATDATFTSGKIGLWTKADSVTSFDDLEAVAE